MLGLHLVAVALLGGAVVLHVMSRRVGGSRTTTIRLSPSSALHVVELDGRRLLVGTGPSSAPALLAELEPAVVTGGDAPVRRDDRPMRVGLAPVEGLRAAIRRRGEDGEVQHG
jgi:hypothetical protein